MIFPRQSMPRRDVGELALPPMTLPRGVDVRGTVVGERQQARRRCRGRGDLDQCGGTGPGGAGAERPDRRLHAPWRRSPGRAEPHRLGRLRQHARRHGPGRGRRHPAHRPDHQPQEHDAHRRPGRRPRRQADRRRVGPDLAAGPGQGPGASIVVDPIAAEDGSVVLRTDAEGRYRTRRRFPAHAEFYAEASAPAGSRPDRPPSP